MTFKDNKDEIKYNIVNSALAGLLVFFGSFTAGGLTLEAVTIAFMASMLVAVTKFKDYWTTQENEYRCLKKTYINFL